MTHPPTVETLRTDLVGLSRRLGDPAADLAILGEGNTSADVGDGSFLVKASGASLARAGDGDFVRVNRAAILALIDDATLDEYDVTGLGTRLRDAVDAPDGVPARPPSIEAMLHALALDLAGARYVGHTHPTAVNRLLCSDRAAELVAGALFPDQVVVCGRNALLVPYAEPGLPLGRAVRDGLRAHLDRYGTPPKLIYLGNHGIVAMGGSAAEVLQITEMSVKAARILHGALAVGAPRFLPDASADRLDRRPDEIHRRRVLADQEGRTP
jgi:rhamnose utilization protein RhaD (predicted bifunctional aldolase and dehydrogenase)